MEFDLESRVSEGDHHHILRKVDRSDGEDGEDLRIENLRGIWD